MAPRNFGFALTLILSLSTKLLTFTDFCHKVGGRVDGKGKRSQIKSSYPMTAGRA